MQNPEECRIVWVYVDGGYLDEGRQVEIEGQTEIHGLSVLTQGRIIELIERGIDASGERKGSIESDGKSYGWRIL